ncbi:iron-containing redox enzyme family protein [Sandaracinus amylolyticus]|nr:iron-containing redox enzyme family protein [Sandaracinus amylolyticus]
MHVTEHRRETSADARTSRDELSPDALHKLLSELNARRLRPATPDTPPFFERDHRLAEIEERFLQRERAVIAERARQAPTNADEFVAWFESLEESGPGQHDPLFDWLANDADLPSMRWFLEQELAGEAGFDDLVALTQRKMDVTPKLELARNYWDEMGVGHEDGMHGPMLGRLAQELELDPVKHPIVWESIALGNLLMGLAYNRRYAYHSVGALGAVELTAPGRCVLVERGLARLGLSGAARRYYALHAVIDRKHSERWDRDVIKPLVAKDARLGRWIAEGALMRLEAGRRTFERYKRELGLSF